MLDMRLNLCDHFRTGRIGERCGLASRSFEKRLTVESHSWGVGADAVVVEPRQFLVTRLREPVRIVACVVLLGVSR